MRAADFAALRIRLHEMPRSRTSRRNAIAEELSFRQPDDASELVFHAYR